MVWYYLSGNNLSNKNTFSFSLLPLGRHLLPWTTLNRYLSRDSNKKFFFTRSTWSGNVSISRQRVFPVATPLSCFIEFSKFRKRSFRENSKHPKQERERDGTCNKNLPIYCFERCGHIEDEKNHSFVVGVYVTDVNITGVKFDYSSIWMICFQFKMQKVNCTT